MITSNGLESSSIKLKSRALTLPGYFRPTKSWDMLIVQDSELVAVIELKSHVGPSFGNNFNNRTEEALGNAIDFGTAYREGAFGNQPFPFVGWLMLLEDTEASRRPVSNAAPHFAVFPEFDGASYAKRYHLLCAKMMQEQLYTSAALMLTKHADADSGDYSEFDVMTGLRTFLSVLAGHVASAATRRDGRK